MSLGDTFKTYNPVTLTLGILFVAAGFWTIAMLLAHGVRTAVGGLFIFVLFILFPLSLGIAIIHNQLGLRKRSK